MKGRNYEKVEKVRQRWWRGRKIRDPFCDRLAFPTIVSQGVEYWSVEMLFELRAGYEGHLTIVQVWRFVSFFGMVFGQTRISWFPWRSSALVRCDVFILFICYSFFKNKPLPWPCLICFSSPRFYHHCCIYFIIWLSTFTSACKMDPMLRVTVCRSLVERTQPRLTYRRPVFIRCSSSRRQSNAFDSI